MSGNGTGRAAEPLLEIRDLSVVFDGFRALDGVDLTVAKGELRFLIGPNGAGKTTLVDVITGLTRPASGSVRFAGTELVGRREHEIVRLGVGRTFQTRWCSRSSRSWRTSTSPRRSGGRSGRS